MRLGFLLGCALFVLLGLVGTTSARAAAVALVGGELPEVMCPAEGRLVEVTLRNDSGVVWSPSRRDRVAYHWLRDDGAMADFEGLRTELPHEVAPGEGVTVRARLRAPGGPGRYRLQWTVVREGARWYPPAALAPEVEVVGGAEAFAWSVRGEEPRSPWRAGEVHDVALVVENHGCATWSPEQGDQWTYHWYDAAGRLVTYEGLRTPSPVLAPGQAQAVTAAVEAPTRPGTYWLVWEPVREGVAWWGPPMSGEAAFEVDVEPGPLSWSLLHTQPLSALPAGDETRVEVEVRNEGTEVWSAATGDFLAYRWRNPSTHEVIAEGLRTPWPHEVLPGEVVRVQARVIAPDHSGPHLLAWEPVREGERWYGMPANDTLGLAAAVEVGAPSLAWSIAALPELPTLWAARPVEVPITVRNEGTEAWSEDRADRLSYRWLRADGTPAAVGAMRSELPRDVAPGERISLPLRIRPPREPGDYVLDISPVRDGVRWYPPARSGTTTLVVRVHQRLPTILGLFLTSCALLLLVPRLVREPAKSSIAALVWPLWLASGLWVCGELLVERGDVLPSLRHATLEMSFCALAACVLLWVPHRIRGAVAVFTAVSFATLTLADLAYLRFFGSLVPIEALAAIHHLGDTTGSVATLLQPGDAWVAVVPVSGVLIAAFRRRYETTRLRARVRALGIAVTALASIPALLELHEGVVGKLGRRVFSERDNVARLGIVGAHAAQVGRALWHWRARMQTSPELEREVETFLASREAPPPRATTSNNAVVIQVEALQQWVLGASVNGQEITPFMNRAHEQALVFTQIYDQTAQGRTSDAEYLMLSSGHPLAEGALSFLRADNAFETVAHALADEGYATLSAHPFARGFWNRSLLHPRYGFQTSLFRRELGPGPTVGWGLSDAEFLRRMASRLEEMPEPFFAFLITLSLHHPYDSFPKVLEVLDLGALQGTPLGNYLHAMHHFDRALEAFVGSLQRTERGRRTAVLVYGDHVTGLPLDDALLDLAGLSRADSHVRLRLHRVPVLLFTPSAESVGERDVVGGHIDLGPTLLDVLGVRPPSAFMGRSLLHKTDHVVLPDGTAIDADRMFVERSREAHGCFARSGAALPLTDCDDLKARASKELEMSRALLDLDLHREVGRLTAARDSR